MSYSSDTNALAGKAERAFRDAYMRLKNDRPEVLPKGTVVSQNNVAREAGKDPTALKKARYPELVREIQEWVDSQARPVANPKPSRDAREKLVKLEATIVSLTAQRDRLMSELLSAKHRIFEQWQKIQRLEAGESSNVLDFRGENTK